MGQALYRKYRSTSLSEIVGQEHITTALEQAITTNRVSHAYLFTGPRGTGKTSIARILAYAINELPYSTEPQLDIIEIDAASNRRIDEIRDLRDKVYIAPTSSKYKVYIIDEVHMLTREAFNALLKTLEEPPAHVIFILATTDAHKLPETIISRTQRYSFRPVEKQKVIDHLSHIAKQEKIKIDDAALELLAEHGEGSFRDSISMLDQVSNSADKVTYDMVREQLGIPPIDGVRKVVSSLSNGQPNVTMQLLQDLYDQGYRATAIAEQLSTQLRSSLTKGPTVVDTPVALALLKYLLDVSGAHDPEHYLDYALLQAMPVAAGPQITVAPQSTPAPMKPAPTVAAQAIPTPAATPPIQAPSHATPIINTPVEVESTEEQSEPISEPAPTNAVVGPLNEDTWPDVLSELKKQYNTIYGIVRMAHPDFSQPGKLGLTFAFEFHKKRISDPKNRKIMNDTITHITGQHVEIVCIVSKEPKGRSASPAAGATPTKEPEAALQDISSIFGGGELL